MVSCWRARAIGCALGMGLVVVSTRAEAQEEGRAEGSKPRTESVRADIGIGYLGGTGGMVPVATAALEGHLVGPAWLVVGGSGGWSRWEDGGGRTSTSTAANLRVGPRFEWNVIDRFDAGFHGFASASFAHSETTPSEEVDLIDVGGVAGASIHFRASRVFGVRVAIDVVRGGYAQASYGGLDSSAYVQVAPSPAAELTFTF